MRMDSPNDDPKTLRHELGLGLVVVIWGFNFAVMKGAMTEVAPLAFNAVRCAISLGVLWALQRWPRRPRVERSFGKWLHVAAVGLLGHFIYLVLFMVGLERTSSGSAALLIASSPLWTAAVARLAGMERLGRLQLFGLFVSLAGTVLLVASQGRVDFSSEAFTGNVMCAVAAAAWGAYTVSCRPLLAEFDSMSLAFRTLACATPFLWIVAAIEGPLDDIATWSSEVWWAALYAGVLSTGLAYGLWNVGVRALGASRTAAYNYAVPVLALVVGAVFLGESVVPLQIVGGLVVFAGLLLVRRGGGRR